MVKVFWAAQHVISPCDPDTVAARIKRADRRPQGRDLNLRVVRDDLDEATIAVLEHQFPGLGGRLAAATQSGAHGDHDGCNHRTPLLSAVKLWITGQTRVQPLHPAPGTGCSQRCNGA